MTLILTCEHAVNTIPAPFQAYFAKEGTLLNSHRGIDFGALELAQYLADSLKKDLFLATTSRLLIDCNRSLTHAHCFSPISKNFSKALKQQIIDTYYLPYRQPVEQLIAGEIEAGRRVLHLSIHSFTPVFNGIIRNADMGLLYDYRRKEEARFAASLQSAFKQPSDHPLKCRLNYPYQGKSDGFTNSLRKKYPEKLYLGIEVEMNQNITKNATFFEQVKQILSTSLRTLGQNPT